VLHRLLVALGVFGRFLEREFLDFIRVGAVRDARQHPRHGERHERRLVALPEAAPAGVFLGFEVALQILGLRQIAKIGQSEHLGVRRGNERRECARRDARHAGQELDIGGTVREFIVADQRAERLAAERAEFAGVNALEGVALVKVGGLGQILADVRLRGVEHLDLQHRVRERVLDEVMQAAPRPLELEKIRVMHDRRDLVGQLQVDQRDRLVERHGQILRISDCSAQRFLGQRLQQQLGLFRLRLFGRADRLIQQADFSGLGGLRGRFFGFRGHLELLLGFVGAELARERL
jgi:hypothetical protein